MSKINYWAKFQDNVHYHIYNRGINGTNLFQLEKNYYFFLDKWKLLVHPFFETKAYCLMPNHFHFLVSVKPLNKEIEDKIKEQLTSKSKKFIDREIGYNDFLEDQFKRLFSSYALAFNKQEGRTGSLFQKRFKRISLNTYHRIWHILAYIHHNPIHHKFTKDYEKWKFSSYGALLSQRPTLLARNDVLNWFHADTLKARSEFVKHHNLFKIDREEDYLE